MLFERSNYRTHEVYSFFFLARTSQLISNKSLLSQGTGDCGTEENARMTGSFTGLAHQHVWHIAISHLEFGVQFKEMLVNAFPKGALFISITMLVVTARSVEAIEKLELPLCSCFDTGNMVSTN